MKLKGMTAIITRGGRDIGRACVMRLVEEVANLVSFLATEESSFMTGTNVDINGGLLLS